MPNQITLAEARAKSKYHSYFVKSENFDINTPSGRYEWESLNYYNGIILTRTSKRKTNA